MSRHSSTTQTRRNRRFCERTYTSTFNKQLARLARPCAGGEQIMLKFNRAVLAGLASVAGFSGAVSTSSAQSIIGTWENLVTPPPPDPNPLPPNFHRPIGSSGTEGWIDWQN